MLTKNGFYFNKLKCLENSKEHEDTDISSFALFIPPRKKEIRSPRKNRIRYEFENNYANLRPI